jgi:hypothetical protein
MILKGIWTDWPTVDEAVCRVAGEAVDGVVDEAVDEAVDESVDEAVDEVAKTVTVNVV